MSTATARKALRQQADMTSVKALAELLRQITSEPAAHLKNDDLKAALRSQGALARYAVPELSIHRMSLNHQKSIANLVLGDYGVLDSLRKAAVDLLAAGAARADRGNAKSRSGLLARVRELEDERILLLQDLYLLQRAYDLRCKQARNYAQVADVATQARCAKEQKEVDASFSLRKKPVDVGKVTSLEEARKRASELR